MRVTLVKGLPLAELDPSHLQSLGGTDVLILGHGVSGRVNFRSEIKGTESIFADLCELSASLDCLLLAAADTNVFGIENKSVLIIDKGKIVDVCDGEYNPSESKTAPETTILQIEL